MKSPISFGRPPKNLPAKNDTEFVETDTGVKGAKLPKKETEVMRQMRAVYLRMGEKRTFKDHKDLKDLVDTARKIIFDFKPVAREPLSPLTGGALGKTQINVANLIIER